MCLTDTESDTVICVYELVRALTLLYLEKREIALTTRYRDQLAYTFQDTAPIFWFQIFLSQQCTFSSSCFQNSGNIKF